jgi:predicted nucleic acid-binding protein
MVMMGVNGIFLDTNMLVRATVRSAPLHTLARRTIERHASTGAELWISRQVLREYLAVMSRPQTFSAPLAATTLAARVRRFQEQFRVADEDVRVTERLVALLRQFPTGGRQVHDANIIATMQVYDIRQLLTLNTDDFTRFAGLVTLLPLDTPDS